jgi:predicted transposase YdaD
MGAMDQGFKAWLDLCKGEILTWIMGTPVTVLGAFPKELAPAPQLLPDTFYRVRVKKQECLVNIEGQTTIDPTMGRRMYEYGSRADIDSGLPVLSVVLWFFQDQQGRRPPKSPYKRIIDGRVVATWEFINIELYRLTPDAIMETGVVGLLPLLPFTKGATPELIEMAMRQVKEAAPAEQVKPLAGLLGLFTSRLYGTDLVLELIERLFMSTEFLEEFPLYHYLMAKAEARGEARGKAEGKAEGLREATRLGLENRFGPLNTEMQTALSQADEAALKDILAHIATGSLEQLRARLGLGDTQS